MVDLRFPTALQMMLMLAAAKDEDIDLISSSRLAERLGVTPSFVRQITVPLTKAGLVGTSAGRDGGLHLLRAAGEITLREVYMASVGSKCLWTTRDVPSQCFVSGNMKEYFIGLTDEVTEAMLRVLDNTTLAASLSEMRRMERSKSSKRTKPPRAVTHQPEEQ